MANKTYEQILEEYEKFFGMDKEQKSHINEKTAGSDIIQEQQISLVESIEGCFKWMEYNRQI